MLKKGVTKVFLSVLMASAIALLGLGVVHWSKNTQAAEFEEVEESLLGESQPDDLWPGFDLDDSPSVFWMTVLVERLSLVRVLLPVGPSASPAVALQGGSLPLFLLYRRLQIGEHA
ncbi:MAG: hypothetical protein D6722_05955 [Bacteroidetes bacterium]|nr:MAG: hypothetical protein D6722_05955 [Bacteroidota bacterium]